MQRSSAVHPRAASLLRPLFVLVLLLIMSATSVSAQRDLTVRVGAGGIVMTQPDNLDAYLGSGTNLGLDVGVQLLPVSLPGLELVVGAGFDRFTTNESDLLLFFGEGINAATERVDDGTLALLDGYLGLRYTVVSADIPSKPYFLAGVGMYHSIFQPATFRDVDGQIIEAQTSEGDPVLLTGDEIIDTHLGYTAGIGIDFDINDTYGFFVEGRYIVVQNGDYGDAPTNLSGGVEVTTTRYYPIRFGATIRLATFGD